MLKENVSIFQAYKERIAAAIRKPSKKVCVANAIVCGPLMLLLKRHPLDEFHGGTWCLPGGGVDPGEVPIMACFRETYEEAGLTSDDFTPVTTWKVELDDLTIVYYYSVFKNASKLKDIILDNKEHSNYQWCTTAEWMQMDLILDLKQHLTDALM